MTDHHDHQHPVDVNTGHPDAIDFYAGDDRAFERRARQLRAEAARDVALSVWGAFKASAQRFAAWDARRRVLRRL
ncbi:MAG: hypothetical protein ACFBWO_15000 [Paracoccaceae bacterium]